MDNNFKWNSSSAKKASQALRSTVNTPSILRIQMHFHSCCFPFVHIFFTDHYRAQKYISSINISTNNICNSCLYCCVCVSVREGERERTRAYIMDSYVDGTSAVPDDYVLPHCRYAVSYCYAFALGQDSAPRPMKSLTPDHSLHRIPFSHFHVLFLQTHTHISTSLWQ